MQDVGVEHIAAAQRQAPNIFIPRCGMKDRVLLIAKSR